MLITEQIGKIEIEKTSQKYLNRMKYLSNKNGFLGIDNKVNFKEKVVLFPLVLRKLLVMVVGLKMDLKKLLKLLTKLSYLMKN